MIIALLAMAILVGGMTGGLVLASGAGFVLALFSYALAGSMTLLMLAAIRYRLS